MGDEEQGGKPKKLTLQNLKKIDLAKIDNSIIGAEDGDLAFDSSKLQSRQNVLRKHQGEPNKSLKQVIIFAIIITCVALFKFYSGYFMRPILKTVFSISKNFDQKDDFLKLMHQLFVNFASELLLGPDTYSFKLVTGFLNHDM
jgi:hypothetical protein